MCLFIFHLSISFSDMCHMYLRISLTCVYYFICICVLLYSILFIFLNFSFLLCILPLFGTVCGVVVGIIVPFMCSIGALSAYCYVFGLYDLSVVSLMRRQYVYVYSINRGSMLCLSMLVGFNYKFFYAVAVFSL